MPSEVLRSPLRIASLRRTALLDTLPEPEFDRPSRLAARVLRAPVALVSLVDEDRQFFKSCIGLPEPWASRRETPLSHSFCQHVVATGRPLVVEDARRDPLVRDNLAVDDLGVAAYLGVPLRAPDGQVIGSFCVIDGRPREWSDEDRGILQDIAESVMTEIELRLDVVGLRQAQEAARVSEARYRTLIDQAPIAIQVYAPDGALTRFNRASEGLLGMAGDRAAGYNILRDPQLEAEGLMPAIRRAFAGEPVASRPVLYDPARSGLPGRPRWVEATLYAVKGDEQEVREVVLMLQDATERRREEEVQALREGAERVQAIIETAHDAFVGFDVEGRIRHWNRRAEEVFGWTREEVGGAVVLQGWSSPSAPRPGAADPRSGRGPRGELAARDRGGLPGRRPARGDGDRPVPWGGVDTLRAFLRDISERKRADEVRARLLEQSSRRRRRALPDRAGPARRVGSRSRPCSSGSAPWSRPRASRTPKVGRTSCAGSRPGRSTTSGGWPAACAPASWTTSGWSRP
jgi:PAS domain S-box-containing protein